MRNFDLIVVGASFAGLSCARTAALRGLKVAVVERKSDPGADVHTTGILVKEAAEDSDVPASLTRRIRGVRLYAPNGAHTDHWSPGYYFLATDTPNLLRWFAHEASRAGAHIHLGCRFDGGDLSNGKVVLHSLDMTAPLLVGADGATSAVARAFGLARNRKFLAGAEWELASDSNLDQRFLHCILDSEIAPGYIGWALSGVSGIQLGVATSSGVKPNPAKILARYGAELNLKNTDVIDRRSGLIPVGGTLKKISHGPVMLIGDAAGYCSPHTGGGIALALRLGRRVAQCAYDWLNADGEHPARVIDRERPRFAIKMGIRKVLDLSPPNWMWNLAVGTPAFRHLVRRIYFHRRGSSAELPYDDLPTHKPHEAYRALPENLRD